MVCEICGESEVKRFVRDHDHVTGMIRGMLCEQCNSWLGCFEANRRRGIELGSNRYKRWAAKFLQIIEAYLKQDKGIRYVARPRKNHYTKPPGKQIKLPGNQVYRFKVKGQV